MSKDEYIIKYGEDTYKRWQAQSVLWHIEHPEVVQADRHEHNRKGGKFYKKKLENAKTGLSGEKNRIRAKHRKLYLQYKRIIAPLSQIHHEWIPGTADYRGVALVEADQHMHGIIKVIEILEGEITVLGEEEVRGGMITW